MDDSQARQDLAGKLARLTGEDLQRVTAVVDELLSSRDPDRTRARFIRSLPRLVADHPILVGGRGEAGLADVFFGPAIRGEADPGQPCVDPTAPARQPPVALFRVSATGTLASPEDLADWARAVGLQPADVIEFDTWLTGRSRWPQRYNRITRQLTPCSIAQVEPALLRSILCPARSDPRLHEGLRACAAEVERLREASAHSSAPGPVGIELGFHPSAGAIGWRAAPSEAQRLQRSDPPPEGAAGDGCWIELGVGCLHPKADLSGAVLAGVCLMEADLTEARLGHADLCGATLDEAGLQYADLHRARLSGASLRDALLADSDLRGADLRGADLSDADLSGACLQGADLRGACLQGTELTGAAIDDQTRWSPGVPAAQWGLVLLEAGGCYDELNLENRSLDGAILRGASMKGCNLWSTRLPGADLAGACLEWATLSDADLSGADLSGARLMNADLSGADLSGTDLSGADLTDADLSDVTSDESTRWPDGFDPGRPGASQSPQRS